jgi:predicted amidohydrolase YtcJ
MRTAGQRVLFEFIPAALAAVGLSAGAAWAQATPTPRYAGTAPVAGQPQPVVPPGTPDLIIHNAKIVTVDGRFSIARAAAIKGGRFVAVGDEATVMRLAGPATRRVDLKGRTVLPGFNDTHNHLGLLGRNYEIVVDLSQTRSIADIQKAVADRIAVSKPGDWIVGSRGWWEYEMAEGRLPTRYDLDKVSPDNPVIVPGPHYQIANSLALKLGGITRDTPNPQGGEIYKDAAGEPTGLLMDRAGAAVTRFTPRPTDAQKAAGLAKLMQRNNSNGLTSIGDPYGDPETAAMYRAAYDAGALTIRVDFSYSVDPQAPLDRIEAELKAIGAPGQHWGDGMFRSDELGEVGLDGAELSAMLRQDYPDRPGFRGLQVVDYDQYDRFAALANRYGWRLRPHAVGDRAIDQALRSFEYANREKSIVGRRWMIDHAFLLLEDHLPKVKELGLIINSEYMHNAQLGKLILAAWKQPLADKSEQFKLWVDNGIVFANGSDGPVLYDAEPLYQIYGSVTRKTQWGGSLGPNQAISREDAIKSVTINSAYTSFEELVKGSIEPGKYADFVVLSDDVMTVPADTIKDIKVLATVLGGKTVYGDLAVQ